MFDRLLMTTLAIATLFATPAIAGGQPVLGYEQFGSGPEKVIVLHDWMGDAQNYAAVRPWLDKTSFTYIFADVRGYGRSKGQNGAYNSDEVAADVESLADHLGWSRYHLVGHSMNGLAGLKSILIDWQADRRIKSFVAVTPVTPDGYPASPEDEAFLTAAIIDDETAAMAFSALTGGKLNAAWAVRKTARNRATSRPDSLKKYYDMWLKEDFSAKLSSARVKTPVLVIGGRQDLPGFQQAHYDRTIAKWLPEVTFEYVTNAGHYPMQETPVLFATLIEAHMNAHK